MQEIILLDRELFQFLNSFHSEFFDVVMYWVSYKYTWIPLYALLVFLLVKHYQKKSLFTLLAIALMITATDQGCNFFKHNVKRPRPCRTEAQLSPKARTLEAYHCSKYGFFSAHAANSMAIAVFMSCLLTPFYKNIKWFLVPWAVLTAYSRIYLGVHYPLDILCGAVYGYLIARITLRLLQFIPIFSRTKC